MSTPKIITAIEELPDTLWYPQKGKKITDVYRGQTVAESITPEDFESVELIRTLKELSERTLLYERLLVGNGASLDHWRLLEIQLEQLENTHDICPKEETVQARRMYFTHMAKSPALFDFHYINEDRIRENAWLEAVNSLVDRMQITTSESNIEQLEENIFRALKGKVGRKDIRKVITALINHPRPVGQVYKDLLLELVKNRARIGSEIIDPEEIDSHKEDTISLHQEETAEEKRRAKIVSLQNKLKKIQNKETCQQDEETEAKRKRQANIFSVQRVIKRLTDMSFQQSEVLIYGDFLINKDNKGNFVLSYEHPLSSYLDKTIRIVLTGIKKESFFHEAEYKKNIGNFKSLNIYGQVMQRLNLDKEIYDILITPYAIY